MIDRDEFLKELKEEQRFRKVIRGLLENYLAEKKDKVMLEENRLRGIIRSLIKEVSGAADVPDSQPQRATGINAVAKIDIASVIQNTAINKETPAAFIASGFMSCGGSIEMRKRNADNPKPKPIICFLFIFLPYLQKDK